MRDAAGTHASRLLRGPEYPEGWVVYLSRRQPRRLVVFVHGFRGRPTSTWSQFPDSGRVSAWWEESDMLFVRYDSVRETLTGVAGRLREALPRFYPRMPGKLLEHAGARLRAPAEEPYRELYLVGHSLGGLIVRRALSDVAQNWLDRHEEDPQTSWPPLLDAQIRLFSPASAGFRAAGLLGIAQASPFWLALNLYLRRSSAYVDLLPGSPLLSETRRRTEALVKRDATAFRALRARIAWANPEDVVIPERYDTDFVDETVHGTTHSSICKPSERNEAPWRFVETGTVT